MKLLPAYFYFSALILISSCNSQPVSSTYAWAIVKISYDPATKKAEGGSCGTAFFINETTFVTAHHGNEVNSAMLKPNAGYPNVRVFLANTQGDIIDDFLIVKRAPEFDLALGRIGKANPAVRVCELQTAISAGEKVYNIGFPTDQDIPDYSFLIEGQKLIIQRIRMNAAIQEGCIQAIRSVTINSNDVNLQDKMVAVLDHSSRIGFSGGPLVSKSSGKVIGFMSFVVPKEFDPQAPAAAIRMSDIEPFLAKEGAAKIERDGAPQK
jgi:hypothetical protein